MTEAELRRLAEIMVEIAPGTTRSPSGYWAILTAFVAGVLVNSATDWLRHRAKRRAELRVTRASLARNLSQYRVMVSAAIKARERQVDEKLHDALENRPTEIWGRVHADLIAVDDEKYTRLIGSALIWNDAEVDDRTLHKLDQIIKQLKQDTLRLLDKLSRESLEADLKRWERDNLHSD